MGRFYVDIQLTVYADTEDEAIGVGEEAKSAVNGLSHEKIGNVEIGDVDEDSGEEEE